MLWLVRLKSHDVASREKALDRHALIFVPHIPLADAVADALTGKALDMTARPLPHSMALRADRRARRSGTGADPAPPPPDVAEEALVLQRRFLGRAP